MFLNSIKFSFNSTRNLSFKLILNDNYLMSQSLQKCFHSSGYNLCSDNDKPVKYTASAAHLKHKSYQNFRLSQEEIDFHPTYERPILLTSLAIFIIYFGILREPNDIDERLGAGLFDTVPGLEISLIESAIKSHEMLGMDTTELNKRFDELKQLKEQLEQKKD